MNRRQLFFIVLLNSLISLVVAVTVVWLAEMRRPDVEELAAAYTPPPVILIATPTPGTAVDEPIAVPTADLQAEPTPTPVAAEAEPEIYVVQPGETLFGIAVRYSLTVDQLMEANNLSNPDYVFSGQRLEIPRGNQPQSGSSGSSAEPADLGRGLALRVEQPGNLNDESVLIVNESNNALNLQGWTLGNVDGPVYSFGNLPLFPGSSVRLHSEAGQDDSLNLYWGQSGPVWESGAVARLFNANGREIASYTVP